MMNRAHHMISVINLLDLISSFFLSKQHFKLNFSVQVAGHGVYFNVVIFTAVLDKIICYNIVLPGSKLYLE